MHTDETICEFLVKSCFDVASFIYRNLYNYHRASIERVAQDIGKQFKKTHSYTMIFLGTEIAKDLTYFYPEQIDPNSICLFNSGARSGLRWMHELGQFPQKFRMTARIEYLLKKTGMSYSTLEHAICEYGKYCKRKKAFPDHKGSFPKKWSYTPSSEPLYKSSNSLSA